MVRVIAQKKSEAGHKKLLDIIAKSIDAHPSGYAALLERFNMPVKNRSDRAELRDKVLVMLSKKNERFNEALSEQLGESLENTFSYNAGEDNFDLMKGIESLSGALGKALGGDTDKHVANQEMRKGLWSRLFDAKDKQAELAQKEKKDKANQKMVLIAGISLVVITIGAIVIYKSVNSARQLEKA